MSRPGLRSHYPVIKGWLPMTTQWAEFSRGRLKHIDKWSRAVPTGFTETATQGIQTLYSLVRQQRHFGHIQGTDKRFIAFDGNRWVIAACDLPSAFLDPGK